MNSNLEIGQLINNYRIIKESGRGAFSIVYHAVHEESSTDVALKIVSKFNFKDVQRKLLIENEKNILKTLDFPFIAEYYDYFETETLVGLVMEYVDNGSCLSFVNKYGVLSEENARHFFCQLIATLVYLYQDICVSHRDIKAENILIDKNFNIKLIDFGFSHFIKEGKPILCESCGSPAYASPEVLKGQPFSLMSDIWSSGIFLYAILVGQLPFVDENIQRLQQKVIYTEPKYPQNLNSDLKDLLTKLLKKKYSQRIQLFDIWCHPWILQYKLTNSFSNPSFFNNYQRIPIDQSIIDEIINEEDLLNNSTKSTLYRIKKRQNILELTSKFSNSLIFPKIFKNNNLSTSNSNSSNSNISTSKTSSTQKTEIKFVSRPRIPSMEEKKTVPPIPIQPKNNNIGESNSGRSRENKPIIPLPKPSALIPNNKNEVLINNNNNLKDDSQLLTRQQQLQKLMENKKNSPKSPTQRRRSDSMFSDFSKI